MKRADGTYERRSDEHQAIVHVIQIKDSKIVDAWVYQVEGNYSEPGFAATVVGKNIADIDMTGYKRVR